MAVTQAARQLSIQHRRAQQQVRAAATRDALTVWTAGFDLDDIDRSWLAMQPAMEAVTRDYRRQSSNVASGYFQAYRTAEGVPGTSAPRLAVPPSPEVLRYSLGFYGGVVPNQLYRAGRTDVAQQAFVQLAGGMARLVQDGGRDTIIESVAADRQARGWQRITGAKPCSFCAMIAMRGAVFTEATGDFKAHDHCACSAEPVYGRGDQRPEQARQWQELWNESTRDLEPGDTPMRAFRRAYEAQL